MISAILDVIMISRIARRARIETRLDNVLWSQRMRWRYPEGTW